MVFVAQLAEPWIVIPVVAGSSPVKHPIQMRYSSMAERQAHNLKVTGSSPVTATKLTFHLGFICVCCIVFMN